MHIYSYGGCDSDLPGSDLLPDSEEPQFQRSLIILLDDDEDEDEFEQSIHPPPSHRPKRPLPRRLGRKCHSQVNETGQGKEMSRPEADHASGCTPGLRDNGFEDIRMEPCVTMGEPPKPINGGMGGNPPNFLPWCEPGGNTTSQAGQVESIIPDVSMDD